MTTVAASGAAYQRGLSAGRLDYLISACPYTAGAMSTWQRGWFKGMREAGHQIPIALKPLEARR